MTAIGALHPASSSFVDEITARVERLPASNWHLKAKIFVGIATFFDGLDVLAIAYVLPVIAPLWKIDPAHIGLLISAGFVGQLVGAILFGWMGERFGRIPAMTFSILCYSIMSLACAFAPNYWMFFLLRTLQGVGLGGELPVAATYISEISKAKGRGRSVLFYQLIFPVGLAACALIALYVVPHLGWRYLFAVGALPALLTFFLRRTLPESPRWLAAKGRVPEANKMMAQIEDAVQASTGRPLPEPIVTHFAQEKNPSWRDLFGENYRVRTLVLWVAWFATSLVNYGIAGWLPSVYRNTFKLGVDASLQYNIVTTIVGLIGCVGAALLIDSLRRGYLFALAFACCAVAMGVLWYFGPTTPEFVMVVVSIGYFFVSMTSLSVWAYTPELYPTRIRAFGAATASSIGRFASIVGPIIVGVMLVNTSLAAVFLMFGCIVAFAAIVLALFAIDTRDRVLEEVSP
jgi:putative MFS transporter